MNIAFVNRGNELLKDKIDILNFIDNFKYGFNEEYLEHVFTNGNCFHFATILKSLYPDGEIAYDQIDGHFIFEYLHNYYDITGQLSPIKVTRQSYRTLHEIGETDALLYRILERDCMYKVTAKQVDRIIASSSSATHDS